jgi:hypothetical protein
MGQWELKSETIEFSGCPDDYEDDDNEFDEEVFFTFTLDGNWSYSSSSSGQAECTGTYNLDDDCETEVNFGSACPDLDMLVGLLENGEEYLTLCFDDDEGVTAVGEFDLHAIGYPPDAPEGCILTWTGEFRED